MFSPDGQLVAYDNIVDGIDHVTVAGADGSNPRIILDEPFTGACGGVVARQPIDGAHDDQGRRPVGPVDRGDRRIRRAAR